MKIHWILKPLFLATVSQLIVGCGGGGGSSAASDDGGIGGTAASDDDGTGGTAESDDGGTSGTVASDVGGTGGTTASDNGGTVGTVASDDGGTGGTSAIDDGVAGSTTTVSELNAVFRPLDSNLLSNSETNVFRDEDTFEVVCRVPEIYSLGTFSLISSYIIENHSLFTPARPEYAPNSVYIPGVQITAASGTVGSETATRIEAYDTAFTYDGFDYSNFTVGAFEPFWRVNSNPDEVIVTATCSLFLIGSSGDFVLTDEASTTVSIQKNTRPVITNGEYFYAEFSGQEADTYICSLPDCNPNYIGDLLVADKESDEATVAINFSAGPRCELDAGTVELRSTATPNGIPIEINLDSIGSFQSLAQELENLSTGQPYFRQLEIEVFDDLGLGGIGGLNTVQYKPFNFYVCPENTQPAISNVSGASCSRVFRCI